MENREAELKETGRTTSPGRTGTIVSKPRRSDPIPMDGPVPWSLAWREDGELAPQDRFDLLQTLVQSETQEAQPTLIEAIEQLALSEVSVLSTGEVTRLCA